MTITVIVPTYKRVPSLQQCVAGILEQTLPPEEIIIVVRSDDKETLAMLADFNGLPSLRTVYVQKLGQVAALNAGMEVSRGDIICITDDDSVPRKDWLKNALEHFLKDNSVGGVGGRDWVRENNTVLDADVSVVGKIQWFGRVIGNHHLGSGPARCVEVLKGVNFCFKASAAEGIRFDENLRGDGAQVYNDMAFSLMLMKAGWKLIYDPDVSVDHYPAVRADHDQRNSFNWKSSEDRAFNETWVLLHYFGPLRRVVYLFWATLVGTRVSPGVANLIRLQLARTPDSWNKFASTLAGRRDAFRSFVKAKMPATHRTDQRSL